MEPTAHLIKALNDHPAVRTQAADDVAARVIAVLAEHGIHVPEAS